MADPGIVKFEPHGPHGSGLVEWDPIAPDEIETGSPAQRGHIYHEVADAGYMAGVWDCTAMTLKFGPYPVHEFMFLLEGSVTLVLEDGSQVTVRAGESFVIPKGLPCKWVQPDYVRKFFMIFEEPGKAPLEHVAKQGVILPDPSAELAPMDIPDASVYIGETPNLTNQMYFDDPSGQMHVGIWSTTASNRHPVTFPRNELMCLLEGSVTLSGEDGEEQTIQAGEAVYVSKGTQMRWHNSEPVRKIYAIYDPK